MDEQRALDNARRWCSRREYCTEKMREKLLAAGLDSDAAERVLHTLQAERFIDDRRYLRSFVGDKWQFGRWGRQKICHALRQQGFRADECRAAWDEVDREAYLDMMRGELSRKFRSIKQGTVFEKRQKTLRFGASRGYDLEEMALLLEQICRMQ